jgi:hypothetical protein
MSCTLRADIVERNSVYSHQQSKDGFRLVSCKLDVAYVGSDQTYLEKEQFRLKQPDGDVIAADEAPYGSLGVGKALRDQWLFFKIRYPAQPGAYVLQLMPLVSGKPSPTGAAEFSLTIP